MQTHISNQQQLGFDIKMDVIFIHHSYGDYMAYTASVGLYGLYRLCMTDKCTEWIKNNVDSLYDPYSYIWAVYYFNNSNRVWHNLTQLRFYTTCIALYEPCRRKVVYEDPLPMKIEKKSIKTWHEQLR